MDRVRWTTDKPYRTKRALVRRWRIWVSQAGSGASFGWYWGATGAWDKNILNASVEHPVKSERAAKASAVKFARR